MIKSILFYVLSLFLFESSFADDSLPASSSIAPELIDFPGVYQLVIPDDIFQSEQSHLEADLRNGGSVVSAFLNISVKYVYIGQPTRSSAAFPVRTYSSEKDLKELNEQKDSESFGIMGQFEARLMNGLRGPYCSLEISGIRQEGTARVPFREYYLVLALGLKDEQSLWLGPVNTPADAIGGMHVNYILEKTSD